MVVGSGSWCYCLRGRNMTPAQPYKVVAIILSFVSPCAAWPCKNYGDHNIEELCGDVHSDNPLHSMFRKQPKDGPVRCPFTHPPYTFSYNKGTGECQSPVSRVDSCMDSSRLLIRNAACADVAGAQDLGTCNACNVTWNIRRVPRMPRAVCRVPQ